MAFAKRSRAVVSSTLHPTEKGPGATTGPVIHLLLLALGLWRSALADRATDLIEEIRQSLEEGAILLGDGSDLNERTEVESCPLRLRQLLAQRLQLLNLLLQLLELLLVRLLMCLDSLRRLTLLRLLGCLRLLSLRVLTLLALRHLLALRRLRRLLGLSHEIYLEFATFPKLLFQPLHQ